MIEEAIDANNDNLLGVYLFSNSYAEMEPAEAASARLCGGSSHAFSIAVK